MYETRVNLQHLLEDIKDSYVLPVEEVIIVELIANALDSKAKSISFFIDNMENCLTVIDDGQGMKRENLKEYHNIASTTKQKGQGIGFAGVGAKLSLLLAEKVITETKGGYGTRAATMWYLSSAIRAPWKFVPFSGKVKTPRGTAVSVFLKDGASSLLSRDFVKKTIFKHFLPLFIDGFQERIFRYIYPKGISFLVEDELLQKQKLEQGGVEHFSIHLKSKAKGVKRSIAGFGFLVKSGVLASGFNEGIAISTFGKIIKRGWEWLGIDPVNKNFVGLVEIPQMAEILTTNKTDFLQDSASLKKYYRCRKAIQEAVLPLLAKMGEVLPLQQAPRKFSALTKDIERAVSGLLHNFPELGPLIGIKPAKDRGVSGLLDNKKIEIDFEQDLSKEKQNPLDADDKVKTEDQGKEKEKTKKRKPRGPKITIAFEENTIQDLMGRMLEDTIWINILHPAYSKSISEGLEQYHILLAVAWVMAGFIEPERSPLEFVSQFLGFWGKDKQSQLLFSRKQAVNYS